MGQTVKKKKGRPPKADPGAGETLRTEHDLRRGLRRRRRNVKYVFELDDYFDDDEEVFDDDDEHRRKAKKLKLLLNIQSDRRELDSTAPGWSCSRRVDHAPNISAPFPKNGGKLSKTRKFKNEIDEDMYYPNDDTSDGDNNEYSAEVIEEKPEHIAVYSPSGTPTYGLPLPDKKTLELILHKLQKKDIYGVYAEPVDPEELPDYHDKIKHPMDFATVRNNLRNGSYETMEQFEHDVFLICSNAMQYNETDTIYHKQARLIKELAIKKFHKIRLKAECSGKDVKLDQKMRPVNSDALVEGNYFLYDNLDEGEMQTGKGTLPRFLNANAFVQEENRRATYNPSLAHSLDCSESLFLTFEGESKQLVPVGLYSDHSYARSLARFAATLGSVAWKFASMRIEQALPQGIKFGRGWVGEYEPLPSAFVLENCTVEEPPFFAKVKPAADHTKFKNVPFITPSAPSIIASLAAKNTEKPSLFLSPRMNTFGANLSKQHQKSRFRTSIEPNKKILKQFESTGQPTFYKPHEQEQGLSNPVQLMRVLSEKGRNQQIFLNQSLINVSPQLLSSAPSSFINDSNLAAFHAAGAWTPMGTGKFRPDEGNLKQPNNQICFDSPCNSLRIFQPQDFPSSGGMHVQPDRISTSSHTFVPVRVGSEMQFHNQQTFYPHLTTANMPMFPIQPTWWNLGPNLDSDFQSPDPALHFRQFI